MADNIVEFKNVIFGYNKNVININNVSFEIKENEYVCVIGHNGSGKSTISKLLVGLEKPKSGEIFINKQKITDNNIHYIMNNISIIFQNPDSQFVGLTVEDDIAFGMENHNFPQNKMKKIIDVVTNAVGMNEFLTTSPNLLSGGQKQRVAIASALAINTKILIFDESTALLDPNAKEDLKKLMYTLKKDYGKTIISITHDMEEITKADKIIVMSKGKVVKIGTSDEMYYDKDFLTNLNLDVPFIVNVLIELNKRNKKGQYKLTANVEEAVKQICQK
ncbi:MAG: energy-coupling factor transporter ATPase [Mycoplasmataceae bacterium]|jgi:energy-coupling factor transport system ATP-binding protein|nr:energy-coupling factor transporter ATPase [Mycoplasmataceae bacterium]